MDNDNLKNDVFLEIFKIKNKNNLNNLCFFDVGAHIGQSAIRFKKKFKTCTIHCFEPYEQSYNKLIANTKKQTNIIYNNIGLSSESNFKNLYVNEKTETSSFYNLNNNYFDNDKTKSLLIKKCKIDKLDNYVESKNINKIDYLKIDVQGEEYPVLVGSENTIKNNMISFIEVEIILNDYYLRKYNNFSKVVNFMEIYNYKLLNLNNMDFDKDKCLKWFDLLFISKNIYP